LATWPSLLAKAPVQATAVAEYRPFLSTEALRGSIKKSAALCRLLAILQFLRLLLCQPERASAVQGGNQGELHEKGFVALCSDDQFVEEL
jgi:hypothetical protein